VLTREIDMKTRTGMFVGGALLALSLAACGQKSDTFDGATPDVAGLTLEVQGGAAEGLPAASMAAPGDLQAATIAAPPSDGDDLATIRGELRHLNGEVRRVMEKVEEAVAAGGAPAVGDRMIYGPADRCVVPGATATDPCVASANFVLGVKHEREHLFSWLLQARPTGSTDNGAFKSVAAGWMARGGQLHRGVGRLALNLKNLKAVTPGYLGDGYLLAGFANGGQAKSLRFLAVEFTPDGVRPPLSAAFVGWKNAAGLRRVRVATPQEVLAPATGADMGPELLLARAAWLPGVAGRTYAIVTNWQKLDRTVMPPVPTGPVYGDVPGATPTSNYYLGRACYAPASPGAPLTLKFKEWFSCDRPESPAACILRQGGAGTVVFPAAPTTLTWAADCRLPNEPTELSDPGDDADHPEHDGDEPGMMGPGMQSPPAAPGNPGDVSPPAPGMGGMSPMM
jgi:hypothetical protein